MTGFIGYLQYLLKCHMARGGKRQWEVTGSLWLSEQKNSIRRMNANFWHCWVLWTVCRHLLLSFWVHSYFSAPLGWSSMLTVWSCKLTLLSVKSGGSGREAGWASAPIRKSTAPFLVHCLCGFPLLFHPSSSANPLFSPCQPLPSSNLSVPLTLIFTSNAIW